MLQEKEPQGCVEKIGEYATMGAVVATTISAVSEFFGASRLGAKKAPQMAFWADAAGRAASRTARGVIGMSVLAVAECSMAEFRNKDDLWNISFAGSVLGAYSGLRKNNLNGVVLGAGAYAVVVPIIFAAHRHLQADYNIFRRPEDNMKKAFAYMK